MTSKILDFNFPTVFFYLVGFSKVLKFKIFLKVTL